MAPSQEDVEAQVAQPPAAPLGEGPKTWRQRACESLRGYYIVDYTSLRKLIDPEWRAFLANNVKADPVDNFPDGPAFYAAAVQGSEEMAIFRRFDWLSTYCLIDAQRTLARSEAELLALCAERNQPGAAPSQTRHDALVKSIQESLAEYSTLAEAKYKLLEYRDPEAAPFRSLLTLIQGGMPKLHGLDSSWLFKVGDLMTLDPRPPKTHLATALETLLVVLPDVIFFRLHMTNKIERQRYPDAKSISYDRLMALTLIVSTILALIFVLAPVGLLYFFVGEWTKWQNFGVIIGWSVGFLAYLWLATHASSFEALGAAASYCGLLVVFLGLS